MKLENLEHYIPKGTTKEQWERYNLEIAQHRQFIENYKLYLDRIFRHLQFIEPDKAWTLGEIRKTILDEIHRCESMDAPNKPGYFRANND